MTVAAERTWLMVAIELAKMQRDISNAKRIGPGVGYREQHTPSARTGFVRVQ